MKALVAIALSLFATTSVAQNINCGPSEQVYSYLENDYKEFLAFVGMDVGGILLEVFVNPETGTFTLLSTDAQGLSCIQANGEHFQSFALPPNV